MVCGNYHRLGTRCCTVHTKVRVLGFEQNPHKPAMYWRTHGDLLLLLGVYVDDLIITGSTEAETSRF